MPAAAAVATCIALFSINFDYGEPYLASSDGTSAGTEIILRTRSPAYAFTQAGTRVVFVGKDRDHGTELWSTDGTAAGTRILKDINKKARESSEPGNQIFESSFATTGARAIFPATDLPHGREIWSTDGTSAGTRLVKDFVRGRDDGIDERYYDDYIASNGGRTYFLARDDDGSSSLWSTTGTRDGTQRAIPKSIRGRDIHDAAALKGSFLFLHRNNSYWSNYELWMTNGTAKSAKLLKEFTWPLQVAIYHASQNNYMIFTVTNLKSGSRIWVTDGTSEGTKPLRDIDPGHSMPPGLGTIIDGDGFTIFTPTTYEYGSEPWVTRGDAASTRMLMDIIPGKAGTWIYGYAKLGKKIVFSAAVKEGHSLRDRLFITDGTPKGTRMLSSRAYPRGELVSLGDRVLYQDYRDNGVGTDEIWVTYGEPNDEVQISHFADTSPEFGIDSMTAVELPRDAKRARPCPK